MVGRPKLEVWMEDKEAGVCPGCFKRTDDPLFSCLIDYQSDWVKHIVERSIRMTPTLCGDCWRMVANYIKDSLGGV